MEASLFKKQLETFRDIVALVVELWKIIMKNPLLFISIGVIIVIYLSTRYYVFILPGEPIKKFYTSINEKKYNYSWEQLSSNYKKNVFNNDSLAFIKGYSTTNNFSEINVTYKKSKLNPFVDFFKKERSYYTTYLVQDLIPKNKLSKKGIQSWNSFWIEVKEEKPIDELRKMNQAKFKIKRKIRQNVKLIQESGNWKIAEIEYEEIGLVY